jgi:hypothetical protein
MGLPEGSEFAPHTYPDAMRIATGVSPAWPFTGMSSLWGRQMIKGVTHRRRS